MPNLDVVSIMFAEGSNEMSWSDRPLGLDVKPGTMELLRARALGRVALVGMLLAIADASVASTNPSPQWVKQIAPGTWAEVSLNTLADVDPSRDPEVNPNYPRSSPWLSNQRAVLESWNGGALATGYGEHGALILCGGGHADYYGNEVYAFDIASRRWQRLTNPYPSPVFPIADGIWPDGTPSVPHTYDQVEYHAGTNSFLMMRTQYNNLGGYNSPMVAMFSLDGLRPPDSNANRDYNRRNWRLSPLNSFNHANSGGWSVYDSRRDLFWINGGAGTNTFASFDPKPAREGGRFGTFNNFPKRSTVTHAVAALDPRNDIIAFTTFRDSPDVLAVDLSHPASGETGNVKLQQTGTPPVLAQSHGWEWSPSRHSFVYYNRGAGVYEFKQQGENWRTSAWQWSELTTSGNAVVPAGENTAGSNGVFSRFRLVSFDDAEIALLVTQVNGPVYAFRMPDGEQRRVPRSPRIVQVN